MFVAGKLVVGGIKAVPTGTRNIDLRPGMCGAVLTFVHLDVPRDEPRPETPMPCGLHHEDREIPGRAAASSKRVTRQLDSRIVAMSVFERLKDVCVQFLEKLERTHDLARPAQIA